MVHYFNGHDIEVAYAEGFVLVDFVQLDGRDARIAVLGKTIWQHLQHTLASQRICINIDFAELTVGSDVIHAAHVVVVGVGDKDAVYLSEGLRHNLLSEVRSAVYEQARGLRFDECRTAQPLVVWVRAGTSMTLAADGWHATRCSRS